MRKEPDRKNKLKKQMKGEISLSYSYDTSLEIGPSSTPRVPPKSLKASARTMSENAVAVAAPSMFSIGPYMIKSAPRVIAMMLQPISGEDHAAWRTPSMPP